MLDYETENNNSIVHWSNDGNSFIVTDKTKFEAVSITEDFLLLTAFVAHMTCSSCSFQNFVFPQDIYPTYFHSRIIFTTFLSKLYRWGFSRLTTKCGRYEFRSPTFVTLTKDSSPASAAAAAPAAAADRSSNAGGGASVPAQQQQQAQAASTLQQVMAQTDQPPAPNPLPSQVDGIAALISNIQHSSQQPSISSQQSVLNRLLNMNLFHQQPFQQWQHPNPTINLLNTALNLLAGHQTPSAPLIDYSPVSSSHQGDAMQALMSLYGMSSRAGGTFPNTNTTPAISQPDNAVQSLLMLIYRVWEDDRQRRAQADSVQNAINASIGQILGVSNTIDEAERQRGLLAAALGQTLGSTGDATTPNVPLAATHLTGMTTLPGPYIAAAGQMQQGIPPPSAAGSLNFQSDPIAAILQAARRPDDDDGDDEGKDDRPRSRRKRKSPNDGYSDGRKRKK
jgi:hypothetical protein